MGLFGPRIQDCITGSILPVAAKNEILQNRLPILKTDKIFLKKGEHCCYIDKAILNTHVTKTYRQHFGHTSPGLFKGTRFGTGFSRPIDVEDIKQQKGILYITDKRVIFQAPQKGFEKQHRYLTSIEPYANAVFLQYGEKIFELIVPDGTVVNQVLKLINS